MINHDDWWSPKQNSPLFFFFWILLPLNGRILARLTDAFWAFVEGGSLSRLQVYYLCFMGRPLKPDHKHLWKCWPKFSRYKMAVKNLIWFGECWEQCRWWWQWWWVWLGGAVLWINHPVFASRPAWEHWAGQTLSSAPDFLLLVIISIVISIVRIAVIWVMEVFDCVGLFTLQ